MMKKLLALTLALAMLLSAFSFAAAEDEKSVNIGVTSTLSTVSSKYSLSRAAATPAARAGIFRV